MATAQATKVCSICRDEKPLGEFHGNRNGALGVNDRCKSCNTRYVLEHRRKNIKAYRARERARTLARHGLEERDYEELLRQQHGQCAICGSLPQDSNYKGRPARYLHIDHCHRTGKVRGLLCGICNRAIGLVGDDPARLRNAAAYLENNQ